MVAYDTMIDTGEAAGRAAGAILEKPLQAIAEALQDRAAASGGHMTYRTCVLNEQSMNELAEQGYTFCAELSGGYVLMHKPA